MAKKRTKRKSRVKKKVRKQSFAMTKSDLFPLLAVLLITAICFFRAQGYDFVNWDDDFNISKNPNLRYLDWANIKSIFSSHVIGNYNPLATLSFAIEKQFFGLNPAVFHTTNILLHLICTFLVYRFIRLLDMPIWGAVAVALIFGIHPMKVESVAWITERKDVLYSAFYLGALINYVKWYKSRFKKKYMIFVVVLFLLSLLSKIQAVALPLSMMALDYYWKRPIDKKWMIEKGGLLLMSFVIGLVGIYFLRQQGSLDSTSNYTFFERILVGIYSYTVYIVKFIVPFRISPLYPYPTILPWPVYASPAVFLGLIYLAWISFRRNWRPLLFGLAFFTVNIMFVLQVVGAGQAFLADRFVYIPYLGLSFPLVYYALELARRSIKIRAILVGVSAVWMVALLTLTWIHLPVWKDSGSLWSHVLKYYQNAALPYRNRAQYYRERQQYDLALADYAKSISIEPDADVVNSRARLYFDRQQWPQALKEYNYAIDLDNNVAEFWINRGAVHAMQGNYPLALSDMTQGLGIDPDFINGYKNRSLVYQALGQLNPAQRDLEAYLDRNPYDATIWYESGRLYRIQNKPQNALSALNQAIDLNSGNGTYLLERARVHATLGNKQQARSDLARAESLGASIDDKTRKVVQ
jgi:protein O-mannosyl-transferase